jgi:hypothetical protein
MEKSYNGMDLAMYYLPNKIRKNQQKKNLFFLGQSQDIPKTILFLNQSGS